MAENEVKQPRQKRKDAFAEACDLIYRRYGSDLAAFFRDVDRELQTAPAAPPAPEPRCSHGFERDAVIGQHIVAGGEGWFKVQLCDDPTPIPPAEAPRPDVCGCRVAFPDENNRLCRNCGGALDDGAKPSAVPAEGPDYEKLLAAIPEEAWELAKLFHATYERLAPIFGYRTRAESAKPWAEVPVKNMQLMAATCAEVLRQRDLSHSRPTSSPLPVAFQKEAHRLAREDERGKLLTACQIEINHELGLDEGDAHLGCSRCGVGNAEIIIHAATRAMSKYRESLETLLGELAEKASGLLVRLDNIMVRDELAVEWMAALRECVDRVKKMREGK